MFRCFWLWLPFWWFISTYKLTGIPLIPWNPGTPIGPWRKRVHIIFHFIGLYISVTCKIFSTPTLSVLDLCFQNQKEQTISGRFPLTTGVSEDRNRASELDWMPNKCYRNVLIRQFNVKIYSPTAQLGKTRCQENKQSTFNPCLSKSFNKTYIFFYSCLQLDRTPRDMQTTALTTDCSSCK